MGSCPVFSLDCRFLLSSWQVVYGLACVRAVGAGFFWCLMDPVRRLLAQRSIVLWCSHATQRRAFARDAPGAHVSNQVGGCWYFNLFAVRRLGLRSLLARGRRSGRSAMPRLRTSWRWMVCACAKGRRRGAHVLEGSCVTARCLSLRVSVGLALCSVRQCGWP